MITALPRVISQSGYWRLGSVPSPSPSNKALAIEIKMNPRMRYSWVATGFSCFDAKSKSRWPSEFKERATLRQSISISVPPCSHSYGQRMMRGRFSVFGSRIICLSERARVIAFLSRSFCFDHGRVLRLGNWLSYGSVGSFGFNFSGYRARYQT